MATATKFDGLISDFYAVESMYWTLKPQVLRMRFPEFYSIRHDEGQRYPLNTLLSTFVREMEVWRDETHPEWARMLRDSLLGMAIGESRHSTAWDRYSGNYELNNAFLASNRSRQSVYDVLSTFAVDDVTVLEELFDCCGWCESFGGDAWAEVTRYVQRYGTVDATTFIDTVVHAVHNGGCAFDKGLLVMINSTSQVTIILDQKRDGSVLDLKYLQVSEQVKAWIERFKRIMDQLEFPCQIPESLAVHKGVEVQKIEWAEETSLELVENEDRQEENEEFCFDCDSYKCTCNECDCSDCKPQASVGVPYVPQPISPSLKPTTEGLKYDAKKVKKQEQEKAKLQGKDYDYNVGKILNPVPLRQRCRD